MKYICIYEGENCGKSEEEKGRKGGRYIYSLSNPMSSLGNKICLNQYIYIEREKERERKREREKERERGGRERECVCEGVYVLSLINIPILQRLLFK